MSALAERWRIFAEQPRAPLVVLGLVALFSTALRIVWISNPRLLIFDENYYVSAARRILGIEVEPDQFYANAPNGLDPNFAHPPLGKLLISLGMRLFGDTPLGWRAGSILFGTLALLALYWLARSAGLGAWSALGATSLMAADPMFLIHGRVGMLEIFVLTFMLVGAAVYLGDRPALAGFVVGVGACVKLVALFLLPAFLIWEIFRLLSRHLRERDLPKKRREKGWSGRTLRHRARALAVAWSIAAVSYFGLLQLLDMRFTTFHNSIEHTWAMLTSFQVGQLDPTVLDNIAPLAQTRILGGPQVPSRGAEAQERPSQPLLLAVQGPQPAEQPVQVPAAPVIRQKGQNLGLAPTASPLEWMFNKEPILYLRAPSERGEVRSWPMFGQKTAYVTHFRVLVNPAIILLAIPALVYSFYSALKHRREDAFFPSAWYIGVIGVFAVSDAFRPEASGHLYYMLVVLPAIYIAIAQLFKLEKLRRFMPLYAVAVGVFFSLHFPFKTWGGV